MLTCVVMSQAALDASARWAHQLEEWAIPKVILAAAPESPWGFSPSMFAMWAERALVDSEVTPSRQRAIEGFPLGGSVLDVGAGGGVASLPLAPPAGVLVAVDESQAMLDVFAQGAERRRVRHTEILGRWPDVAPDTPEADVVVCHHVLYNVSDLAPFLVALNDHAKVRVVVEITDRHPLSDLNPLWKAIHGIDRPTGPTAVGAVGVAVALGYGVSVEKFDAPSRWHEAPRAEHVAFTRRRLCVGPEYDDEIGAYVDQMADIGRTLVSFWWDADS